MTVPATSRRFLAAVLALALVCNVHCGCKGGPVKEQDSRGVAEKILLEIAKRDEIEREADSDLEDLVKVYQELEKMSKTQPKERAEIADDEKDARKSIKKESKAELEYLKDEFKRKIKEAEKAEEARTAREAREAKEQGFVAEQEAGGRARISQDAMTIANDIFKAEKTARAAALRASRISQAKAVEQRKVMGEEDRDRENIVRQSDPLAEPSIKELYTKLWRFAARRIEPINRNTINERCKGFLSVSLEPDATEDGPHSYSLNADRGQFIPENVRCYCWSLAAEWVEALDGVLSFSHLSSHDECHGAQEILDAVARNEDVQLLSLTIHDFKNAPLSRAALVAEGDTVTSFSVRHTTMRLEDLNRLVKNSKNLKAVTLGRTDVEDQEVTDGQTSVSLEQIEGLIWIIDSASPRMSVPVVQYLASLLRRGFQAQRITLSPQDILCDSYFRGDSHHEFRFPNVDQYCSQLYALTQRRTIPHPGPGEENAMILPVVSALKDTPRPARLDISNFCLHSLELEEEIVAVIKENNPSVVELDLTETLDPTVDQNVMLAGFIQKIVDAVRINRDIQTVRPFFTDRARSREANIYPSVVSRVGCSSVHGSSSVQYFSGAEKHECVHCGSDEYRNLYTELERQRQVHENSLS